MIVKTKFTLVFLIFLVFGAVNDLMSQNQATQSVEKIIIPEDVKMIINAKCLNCHMPQSVNKSAKKKLKWEEVSNYDLDEQRKFLKKIYKVIEKNKMPPKKTIKQFPEMELTKEESNKFLIWLAKEEDRLKDN